jgi:two-component system, NtrC family, response regulator HydG
MISSTPLALVADNKLLGQALQARLRDHLPGTPPPLYAFTEVRDHLGPTAAGVFICAAAGADDAAETIRLVQEVRLRQWPACVVVVEADACARDRALSCLDPFVACRLQWPGQAATLLDLLQLDGQVRPDRGTDHARPSTPPPADDSSLVDWVARRLLAQTPALAPLAEPLAQAAAHDVTVLLYGATGTGKTHLARLIHEHSPRRAGRLLVIPCGALAPNLVESEFFGHVKGAFTGADRPTVGKFEAAGDGTILLDEVDALGLEQQAKLLRVLETGEFEPVGSTETRYCRARVIAASNIDLEAAVEQGTFRQDLYYRLNVLGLHLPALRERVADIGPLARGMAARISDKFGKRLFAISPEALALLEAFPWPGNVRQLENVMQQAVLASKGSELLAQHLPPALRDKAGTTAPPKVSAAGQLAADRDRHERRAIERALADAGYCCSRAARALGISRATLYNKIKKYGLTTSPGWAAKV